MITVQPHSMRTWSCESFVPYQQGRKWFKVSNAALPYSAHKKACCDILHDPGLQHTSPVSHVLLQVLQRTYLKRTKIVLYTNTTFVTVYSNKTINACYCLCI